MILQSSNLDLLVAALLLWWAYQGYRRGFLLTVFDTAMRAATLAAVEVGSASVAAYFVARWLWPTDVAIVSAIAVFVVSFEILRRLGESALRGGSDVLLRESPEWLLANRAAGFATGVLWGTLTLTLVLVLLLAFPFGPTVRSVVRASVVGQAVAIVWPAVMRTPSELPSVPEPLGSVLALAGASDATTTSPPQLPFTASAASSVDAPAEADFYSMSNLTRSQNGEPPLTLDPSLVDVARQHSLDMVAQAYFSHQTPGGATPADRIRAAGIPYQRVAENIVFAPTLDGAFQSIMGSPDHRQNQLSPDYTRVGIGVIQSDSGLMVTEDFAD